MSDSATPWIGLDSEGEGEGGMIWENGIDQAPPSTEFSRQEYWSGLPFPSPEDLPNPGIEPGSPALQADTLLSEHKKGPTL